MQQEENGIKQTNKNYRQKWMKTYFVIRKKCFYHSFKFGLKKNSRTHLVDISSIEQ